MPVNYLTSEEGRAFENSNYKSPAVLLLSPRHDSLGPTCQEQHRQRPKRQCDTGIKTMT